MRKMSRKVNSPVVGADGVNGVRLHSASAEFQMRCGRNPRKSDPRGRISELTATPSDIEVFRNVLNFSRPRLPELHVEAVGVSFTGWLSHLRRAGTRCQ